jgi:hypothetical protein
MSFSSSAMTAASFKSPKPRQERNTNFKVNSSQSIMLNNMIDFNIILQVVIRVRPPVQREISGDIQFRNVIAVDDREQVITVSENIDAVVDSEGNVLTNPGPFTVYSFTFDYVYSPSCNQEKVFDTTARHVVDSALQGYNATIFAYGQTGAGKTYTM